MSALRKKKKKSVQSALRVRVLGVVALRRCILLFDGLSLVLMTQQPLVCRRRYLSTPEREGIVVVVSIVTSIMFWAVLISTL